MLQVDEALAGWLAHLSERLSAAGRERAQELIGYVQATPLAQIPVQNWRATHDDELRRRLPGRDGVEAAEMIDLAQKWSEKNPQSEPASLDSPSASPSLATPSENEVRRTTTQPQKKDARSAPVMSRAPNPKPALGAAAAIAALVVVLFVVRGGSSGSSDGPNAAAGSQIAQTASTDDAEAGVSGPVEPLGESFVAATDFTRGVCVLRAVQIAGAGRQFITEAAVGVDGAIVIGAQLDRGESADLDGDLATESDRVTGIGSVLAVYDRAGVVRWTTTDLAGAIGAVAIRSDGYVAVGMHNSTLDRENDEFVQGIDLILFDGQGQPVWNERIDTAFADVEAVIAAEAITFDNSNNVIVTGGYTSQARFGDSGLLAPATSSSGDLDAFIASYTPDGSFRWLKTWGLPDVPDVASTLSHDADGRIFVGGRSSGIARALPDAPIVAASEPDADFFLASLRTDGGWLWSSTHAQQVGDIAATNDGRVAVAVPGALLMMASNSGQLLERRAGGEHSPEVALRSGEHSFSFGLTASLDIKGNLHGSSGTTAQVVSIGTETDSGSLATAGLAAPNVLRLAGSFKGTVDFASNMSLQSLGSWDGFIVDYSQGECTSSS